MKCKFAQVGDRFDTITFEEYGTLKVLPEVLKANQAIALKVTLEDRDIVYLPVIDTTVVTSQKGVSLWE